MRAIQPLGRAGELYQWPLPLSSRETGYSPSGGYKDKEEEDTYAQAFQATIRVPHALRYIRERGRPGTEANTTQQYGTVLSGAAPRARVARRA